MTDPLPQWEADTCAVCPAQLLGPGAFDVQDRPGPQFPYRPDLGWRASDDNIPVCVHPYRVGMPAGAYASAGVPVPDLQAPAPQPGPAALELPSRVEDLEGWLVAVLRTAPSDRMMGAVARAEYEAGLRFASRDVVAAMRRVLSRELARN